MVTAMRNSPSLSIVTAVIGDSQLFSDVSTGTFWQLLPTGFQCTVFDAVHGAGLPGGSFPPVLPSSAEVASSCPSPPLTMAPTVSSAAHAPTFECSSVTGPTPFPLTTSKWRTYLQVLRPPGPLPWPATSFSNRLCLPPNLHPRRTHLSSTSSSGPHRSRGQPPWPQGGSRHATWHFSFCCPPPPPTGLGRTFSAQPSSVPDSGTWRGAMQHPVKYFHRTNDLYILSCGTALYLSVR